MKLFNPIYRWLRGRRDQLLTEVKQIAKQEAERVFVDLLTEFRQKVEERAKWTKP